MNGYGTIMQPGTTFGLKLQSRKGCESLFTVTTTNTTDKATNATTVAACYYFCCMCRVLLYLAM